MKVFRNFIVMLLCLATIFSTVACKEQANEPIEPIVTYTNFIVKDGKTDYKILIPFDASQDLKLAASELQVFFEEATGIRLEITTDQNKTFNGDEKYLSIGKTVLYDKLGLTADASLLKRSGLKLVTKNNSVFMYGATDGAAIYSVYTFLQKTLNYEFYYEDLYDLDKNVTEIGLDNFDIIDIPDFDIRYTTLGQLRANKTLMSRYRAQSLGGYETLKLTNPHTNNTQGEDGVLIRDYIPPQAFSDHWKWFSGTQVCFNARGDAEERQAMVETVGDILIQSFKNDLNGKKVLFGGSDDHACCTCDVCREVTAGYGSDVGAFIEFSNCVKAYVDEWMNSEAGQAYKRDWRIEILAYHAYEKPPVKVDANGNKYATIKCAEGVYPFYAPIGADWTAEFNAVDNPECYQMSIDWQYCCEGSALWVYPVQYDGFLLPLNTFYSHQSFLKLMLPTNPYAVLPDMIMESAWTPMLNYIMHKMFWDVDCDIETLIDNWCNCVYKDAGSMMREMYDETRIHMFEMRERGFKGYYASSFFNKKERSPEFFEKSMLLRWINKYTEIVNFAEENNLGEQTITLIKAERVSPLFYLICIYKDDMTKAELTYYKELILEDIETTGVTKLSIGVTLYDYLENV